MFVPERAEFIVRFPISAFLHDPKRGKIFMPIRKWANFLQAGQMGYSYRYSKQNIRYPVKDST